jgi:hypothetical protein
MICTNEGSQLSSTAASLKVDSDGMLLIVEPDRVGWNGKGGRSFSIGVDWE